MARIYGWGSTASRLEPLWGGSLLFTTKSPEISIYRPRKGKRLSRPWSFPVVLNTGTLDWESSTCWMGMVSLRKNIQLMLEFLKAPFLGLHFSYYTLMTFLMMSFVTLLIMIMLIILLSTLNVIRHLICGNK